MIHKLLWTAVYEGDGNGNPNPPPKTGDENPPVKTFTQEQVNKLLADNKRNLQTQNQQLATQLETLQQNSNLTQQERDDLQTRIDQLQQQYMSKEELAKQEWTKKENQYKTGLDTATKQATEWQGRFANLFKEQVITQAAIEHNAFSTMQMVEYVGPRTEIVPEVGEGGKPTGNFLAVMPIQVEKEGKVEIVKMPVPDAIKTMKSMPNRYGNFFKGEGQPGLGMGGGNNNNPANGGKIEFSPNLSEADYAKWRKQEGLV